VSQLTRARAYVSRLDGRFPRALSMVLLAATVLVLDVATTRTESSVSAVDEREHIDHLIRASRGDVPRDGLILSQPTLRELCSRGSEYIEWPPCKPGRLDPADYAVGGVNVAADTPFYYLVTGPAARLLRAVTPGWESLVTWGRVLGAAWLLLGFYLVLRIGDQFEIPRWPLASALILVAALPIVLAASTTITPDASAIVVGAGCLLAALTWERTGHVGWLVVAGLISATAVLFRTTNGVGVLVVIAYLGFRALARARKQTRGEARSLRQYAVAAVALALSVPAAVAVWDAADERFYPTPYQPYTPAELETAGTLDPLRAGESQELHGEDVFGGTALFSLFPPVYEAVSPTRRSTGPNAPWYQAAVFSAFLLMVGALLLVVFRLSVGDRLHALGLGTAAALIVASPLMVVYYFYKNDALNPTVARFGLSALPAVALVLAAAARERLAFVVLCVVAAATYSTALLTLT